MAAYLKRFVVCSAVVISTGAATWLNPPAQPGVAPAKQSQPAITSQLGSEISPNPRGDVAADAGISVTRWEFSPAIPGRPVYLSMTLDGTRSAGRIGPPR